MIVGAYRARQLMCAHLQDRMPAKVAAVATEAAVTLPEVGEFHPHWVPQVHINRWPAVMVTVLRGEGVGRLDWDEGDPQHLFRWTLRNFLWVRGEGYAETSDRVELYASALMDALLSWPRLAAGVTVEDLPLRVAMSDVEQVPNMRASIAGAYVECVVTMQETADIAPVATADTILVEVAPITEETP